MEGGISQYDDVHQTEVACTGEERLRGTRHANAVDEPPTADLVADRRRVRAG
jgi:hypothetical protein